MKRLSSSYEFSVYDQFSSLGTWEAQLRKSKSSLALTATEEDQWDEQECEEEEEESVEDEEVDPCAEPGNNEQQPSGDAKEVKADPPAPEATAPLVSAPQQSEHIPAQVNESGSETPKEPRKKTAWEEDSVGRVLEQSLPERIFLDR